MIPGTLRDSLFLLAGLLEQQTSLQPQEIMTDTAGYSDVVFGLFWLLGDQFSVLWNTCYMDAAVSKLQMAGAELKPEDLARLSPLGYRHINMLGRYSFALPEAIGRGELRSLRKPTSELAFE